MSKRKTTTADQLLATFDCLGPAEKEQFLEELSRRLEQDPDKPQAIIEVVWHELVVAQAIFRADHKSRVSKYIHKGLLFSGSLERKYLITNGRKGRALRVRSDSISAFCVERRRKAICERAKAYRDAQLEREEDEAKERADKKHRAGRLDYHSWSVRHKKIAERTQRRKRQEERRLTNIKWT